jgi:hypothetical protein
MYAVRFVRLCTCFLLIGIAGFSQSLPSVEFYQQLRAFTVSNQVLHVENFTLKRDRLEMTFTGQFFLQAPIAGKIYGAVFSGTGRFRSEPWSTYEKESVRKFLKADVIDTDFSKAILRFTDDTLEMMTKNASKGERAWPEAQRIADELESRLLKEQGLNLSARITLALALNDQPGVFFAEFDGGKRGRFAALLDHQSRSLGNAFGLNGGEKGLVFKYSVLGGNEIWTAFYDEADLKRGAVSYSDVFDLVEIPKHRMRIDLRNTNDWLRIEHEMDLVSRRDGLNLVSFELNDGLDDYYNERLKKSARVKAVELMDGTVLPFIQDPWDTEFLVLLPKPLNQGGSIAIRVRTEANEPFLSMQGAFHYPLSTTTWYPRHGYLGRTRYDLTFLHKPKTKVISVGERVSEGPGPEGTAMMTHWVEDDPVAFISFAVGPFEIHTEKFKLKDREIPIEFYSLPGGYGAIKEDFVLAELMNGVNFFSAMYGDYSYKRLGAVFFPSYFGQGFPTMLFLPVNGRDRITDFSFIAHEGAHQWWGNQVAWRSYRDQWLSEGFAEYSAALYASRRKTPKQAFELVEWMRRTMTLPQYTDTGIGDKKMFEMGPLIMGHRLSSRRSRGAYTLVYDKGALVLRMLHFLFTDPATGNDEAFFTMMKDFVKQHQNGWASTETFFAVASQHFPTTAIGKKYRLQNLDWFAKEWVFGSELPKYKLRYSFEPNPAGGVFLTGTVSQADTADDFFMPLPLVLDFGEKKIARGTVHALGKETPFRIPLPSQPRKVQLDPDQWVLSQETKEEKVK